MEVIMFKRRLGPDPHAQGRISTGANGCPDIWELDNGSIAIIGIDQTALLKTHLPSSASCGPDERIVVVPRQILSAAKPDIPDLA